MRIPSLFFLTPAGLALSLLGGCQASLPSPMTTSASPLGDPLGRLPAGVSAAALPTRWWVLYHEPALDQLVEQALQNNQDLARADAHVQALLASTGEQRAALWPQAAVAVSTLYGKTANDQTLAQATDHPAPSQWEWGPSVGLGYELDVWGQVHAAIARAEARASAVEAARDQVRLSVAVQTSRAYLDLCSYGARIDMNAQAVQVLDNSLVLAERQRESGVATDLDAARLRSLRLQTLAERPWFEARQRMARYELALLTGQGPDALSAGPQCHSIPHLAADLPAGDAWNLLHRRPDIRQAERELQASAWAVEGVRADLYPKVTLGASLSSSSPSLGGLGDGNAVMFSVGPLITWQFPNLAANRARVAEAQANQRGDLAAWRGTVLAALKDTRQALAALEGERLRGVALDQALQESRQAFQLADRNYCAGTLDGLQRLDAERDLITLQTRQVEARQRQAYRETAVFMALGGGWEKQTSDTQPRTAR